jgi:HSP20 family protein
MYTNGYTFITQVPMSEPKQTIHIRIRDLRRERALTQEELAAALGISRQSINAMEAGRCLPSLPVALQIASYFAVPLTTIFESLEEARQLVPKRIEEESMSQLAPWSPLKEMREALDELMDDANAWQGQQAQIPGANVYEVGDFVYVELALPGYQKEYLSLEAGEDFVAVIGEPVPTPEERSYSRREFAPNGFRRTIALPALVRGEQAEAEMKHGILTVRIPKIVEEKPKTAKISIQSLD